MEKKADQNNSVGFLRRHWKSVGFLLAVYDAVVVNLSYFTALWLRYDFRYTAIPRDYLLRFVKFLPIYTVIALVVFILCRLYRSIWRYAGIHELYKALLATIITGVLHGVLITVLFGKMPAVYLFGGPLLQFLLTAGIRFSYRLLLLGRSRKPSNMETVDRVMIIGAGETGRSLLKDIQTSTIENSLKVVCFIDDNMNKWGRYIDDVRVVGGRDDIMAAVKRYHIDKIYIAVPSASVEARRDITNICKETGCEIKTLPGTMNLLNGEDVRLGHFRDVEVEDLLGRDVISVELDEILDHLRDKVVLITGGGGSIGSELSRQVASHSPKTLIIFDVYENNAYQIQQELIKKYPELDLKVLIGSVRDSRRLEDVFSLYRPDIVYHAAAHKHVPLMEDSPQEAIKNNAIGTYKTAYMAIKYHVPKFVLISTDKAVNPTNIMGASKRVCEMIIQTFNQFVKEHRASEIPLIYSHDDEGRTILGLPRDACTEFVAVRFGNVLGSNGSVIPLFKKQIAEGGPVTVTHPDIIRYFMTIPEAVSLVLQASVYAQGGEIFVFDMGEPVKIDTLARNLIKLSGFTPDEDIKVVYTGLRPGEKLYEEKLMAEEGLTTTRNKLIFIGKPVEFNRDKFLKDLQKLMELAFTDEKGTREFTMEIIKSGREEV
ncbi:MAG: polysaccharide biosynthesis protein [Lachnospiraceae bacterium]|nr:polysaccharide biosynthesis protein [Lachnospiraceae bacterium]